MSAQSKYAAAPVHYLSSYFLNFSRTDAGVVLEEIYWPFYQMRQPVFDTIAEAAQKARETSIDNETEPVGLVEIAEGDLLGWEISRALPVLFLRGDMLSVVSAANEASLLGAPSKDQHSGITRWLEDGFVAATDSYVKNVDSACLSYVTTILFSETDDSEEGRPLDWLFSTTDLSFEFWSRARRDLWRLIEAVGDDVWLLDPQGFGSDAWLTRQGHGCGFWDGDWDEIAGEGAGDKIAEIVRSVLPETYVYIAQDEHGADELYFAQASYD